MKTNFTYVVLSICVFLAVCNNRRKTINNNDITSIFPKGEKIINDNFTGTAYVHMMVKGDSLNDVTVGNVTFEPGARTNWHSHPAGQIILVTEGVGYYQEKGVPKKVLRKGDVVNCASDVEHWHGASTDSSFVQLAISSNSKGVVKWLDSVADDEYIK